MFLAMFANGTKKTEERDPRRAAGPAESMLSTIATGTVIDGNVFAEGDIRVEGKILGMLVCKSRLVVASSGRIEGNVDAQNATVAGEIVGTVVVREILQIQDSGKIHGDVATEKMVIMSGGVFTGNCKMGAEGREVIKKLPAPAGLPAAGRRPAANGHHTLTADDVVVAEDVSPANNGRR